MSTLTELDSIGFLSITGKDAVTFLQGYATCDVNAVHDRHTGLGAMCNIQGRMINSFRIAAIEDGVLLRMDRSLVSPSREFLKKYIVFSKAETRDDSDTWTCFGVVGDDWMAALPQAVNDALVTDGFYVLRISDNGPRFEVWSRDPLPALEAMERAPLENWYRHEVQDGMAWVSAATADAFIPQMFNYDSLGGVSFDKGCYLGQEIVARMQHRGAVNRRLHRGTADRPVSVGDVLYDADRNTQGTIVTSAGSSFLAVVRARDEATPDCVLEDGEPVQLEIIPRNVSAG